MRGRQAAAHLLGDEPLVRRVAEGEEQADGDGLRVQVGQRVEIERLDDPVRPDALVDADAAVERNERVRMVVAEAVEMRTRLAAQVEDVLEAGGADERGPGPLTLEQGVRGDRRPVREAVELSGVGADGDRRLDHRVLLRADVGTALAVRSSPPVSSTASVNVPPTSMPRIATAHVYHGGDAASSAGVPPPVGSRLGAVAAHCHRAPVPRVVPRVVVERPLAVVRPAGLQTCPGSVRHRGGRNGEESSECRVDTARSRLEPDLAARVEPEAHVRPRRRPVERERRLLADAEAVVLEEQRTDRLAKPASGDEIGPGRAAQARGRGSPARPAGRPGSKERRRPSRRPGC